MPSALVIGLGARGREVTRQVKLRVQHAPAPSPVAYYALSADDLPPAPPLEKVIEDDHLPLTWPGSLADGPHIDETSDIIYARFQAERAEREAKLGRIASAMFVAGDRGAEKRPDLDVFAIVDLGVPLSVLLDNYVRFLLDIKRRWREEGHNVRIFILLLALTPDSPYAFPLLTSAAEFLNENEELGGGVFLIEMSDEEAREGASPLDEEGRQQAVVEWLDLVLHGRHVGDNQPPRSARGLGGWGLARAVVPIGEVQTYLAQRLSADLLHDLQTGKLPRRKIEWQGLFPPLVEGERHGWDRPVRGPLGIEVEKQDHWAHLYGHEEHPNLYGEQSVLNDVHSRARAVEGTYLDLYQDELEKCSQEMHRQYRRHLGRAFSQAFLRAGGVSAWKDQLESLKTFLARRRDEAQQTAQHLETLYQEGLYQDPKPPRDPFWPVVIHQFVFFLLLGFLGSVLFMVGAGIIRGQPLALSLLLLVLLLLPILLMPLLQLLWYGVRVAWAWVRHSLSSIWVRLRRRGTTEWQRPPAPHPWQHWGWGAGWGLLTFVAGLGAFYGWDLADIIGVPSDVQGLLVALLGIAALSDVAWFVLRPVRFYELFAVRPPRETATSYSEAEHNARQALTASCTGLLIVRALFLLLAGSLLTLYLLERLYGTGWATLNMLGLIVAAFVRRLALDLTLWQPPLAWVYPFLLFTAFLALKYLADWIMLRQFRSDWGINLPRRRRVWRNYLLGIGLAVSAITALLLWWLSQRASLSLEELHWLRGATVGMALLAIARSLWEWWNDEARVRQLVRDWVEWHDRVIYVRFHQAAWGQAATIWGGLAAQVDQERGRWDTLASRVSGLRERLQEAAARTRQHLGDKAETGTGMPLWVLPQSSLEDIYASLALSSRLGEIFEQSNTAILDCLEQDAESILVEALRPHAGPGLETLWESRTALNFFTSAPSATREALADERGSFFAHWPRPFWSLRVAAQQDAPMYTFIGLPAADRQDPTLTQSLSLLVPLGPEVQMPATFEDERWAVSAIYYRVNVPFDPNAEAPILRSLPDWRTAYEKARRDYARAREAPQPARRKPRRTKDRGKKPLPPPVGEPPSLPSKPSPPKAASRPEPQQLRRAYQALGISDEEWTGWDEAQRSQEAEQRYREQVAKYLSSDQPGASETVTALQKAYQTLRTMWSESS